MTPYQQQFQQGVREYFARQPKTKEEALQMIQPSQEYIPPKYWEQFIPPDYYQEPSYSEKLLEQYYRAMSFVNTLKGGY